MGPWPGWTGAENLTPTAIRSPDRPTHIKSLCRLSYPGQLHALEKLQFSPDVRYFKIIQDPSKSSVFEYRSR